MCVFFHLSMHLELWVTGADFPKHHFHLPEPQIKNHCCLPTGPLNYGFSITSSLFKPLTYNLTLLFQALISRSLPASLPASEALRLLLWGGRAHTHTLTQCWLHKHWTHTAKATHGMMKTRNNKQQQQKEKQGRYTEWNSKKYTPIILHLINTDTMHK